MIDLQTLRRTLGGEVNGSGLLCPGPGHSTADRSLSVKLDSSAPDGFFVHSFAGDDPIVCRDYVRIKAGLPAFKPNGSGRRRLSDDAIAQHGDGGGAWAQTDKPKGRIVAAYDYTDADGALLYQVLRLEPKSFRQRRPDGNGGFIWSARRHVPGTLSLARAARNIPRQQFLFAEGEKDADRVASALDHCRYTRCCRQSGPRNVSRRSPDATYRSSGTTTTPAARRRSRQHLPYMARRRPYASSDFPICRKR